MKYFLPTFGFAAWLPNVEGDARWVVLGMFVGLACLMARAA